MTEPAQVVIPGLRIAVSLNRHHALHSARNACTAKAIRAERSAGTGGVPAHASS